MESQFVFQQPIHETLAICKICAEIDPDKFSENLCVKCHEASIKLKCNETLSIQLPIYQLIKVSQNFWIVAKLHCDQLTNMFQIHFDDTLSVKVQTQTVRVMLKQIVEAFIHNKKIIQNIKPSQRSMKYQVEAWPCQDKFCHAMQLKFTLINQRIKI